MRFRIRHLLLITAIIACGLWAIVSIRYAMTTRSVVSEDLPNGTRVRVIQDFQGEPFNTAIYFDDGDGNWRWYYYTHEDWYWNKADTQFKNGVLAISAPGKSIEIDTQTGKCVTSGSGLPRREHPKSDRVVDLPTDPG